MKIRYIFNNSVEFNPVNRKEISLEVNHDQEAIINQPRPHVGINNLYLSREDIQEIMNYLGNSPGITQGAPFDIELTEGTNVAVINCYMDLMEGLQRSKDGISPLIKMLQSLDWLDGQSESFTYETLYNDTSATSFIIDGITYTSYKQYFDQRKIYVPYVISAIPNYQNAFMAILSSSYILIELYRVSTDILMLISASSNPLEWTAILRLVIEVGFAILLMLALLVIIDQIVNCLIQPVKYHGAMLFIDLLKITAQKMGLNFNSSIWEVAPYNQIALLPQKYNPIEGSPSVISFMGINFGGFVPRGYTSPSPLQKGYYMGIGGDFLRLAKRICNGKIIIQDNKLILERRDYVQPSSTTFQLQDVRSDWNGYNTQELNATTTIRFAVDLNDKNSIDKFAGNITEIIHKQDAPGESTMRCLKGFRQIDIPASRGIRKTDLNFIEETMITLKYGFAEIENFFIPALNVFIDGIGIIIDIINGTISVLQTLGILSDDIPPLEAPKRISPVTIGNFDDRTGALLLENDMVDTPKVLLIDTSDPRFISERKAYLHSQNAEIINSANLFNKFYCIDSFIETPDGLNGGQVHNRFTKITPATNKPSDSNKITLSVADFLQIVPNPKINDNFGEEVLVDSIQWFPEKNGEAVAEIRKKGWLKNPQSNNGSVRSQEIVTNLTLNISSPNGQ